MMKQFSLKKEERLKSKKTIDELFLSSNSYGKSTLRLLWKIEDIKEDGINCKVLIPVPKRKIKKAVNRNKIKRMLKEIYRKNKASVNSFFDDKKRLCYLGILFVGNSIPTYQSLNDNLQLLLEKLPGEYEKHSK